MLSLDSAIRFAHARDEGRRLAAVLHHQRPLFVCVIASTDTALIPGISGAGLSQDHIRFTAAADAELVVHGAARCLPGVPSNPLGPPGPALITRAALELASIPRIIVNAGCRVQPDAPCVELGAAPGGCITEGNAVPDAEALFRDGENLGA
ncbi:MAG TPA: TIGR00303 family protein, partial [Chloroflexota bacterium]